MPHRENRGSSDRVSRGSWSGDPVQDNQHRPSAKGEAMSIDRRHDTLMRIGDVRRRTGLSTSTINRREANGTFPRRIRIGENSVAWYQSDVEAFIANPINYRSPAPSL